MSKYFNKLKSKLKDKKKNKGKEKVKINSKTKIKDMFNVGDRIRIINNQKILKGCILAIVPWWAWIEDTITDAKADYIYILEDDSISPEWYNASSHMEKLNDGKRFHYLNGKKIHCESAILEAKMEVLGMNLLSKEEAIDIGLIER